MGAFVFGVFGWLGIFLAAKGKEKGFVSLLVPVLFFARFVAFVVYHDDYLETLPLFIQRESAYLLWIAIGTIAALFVGYTFLSKKLLSLGVAVVFVPLFIFYTQPIYPQIHARENFKNVSYQSTLYSCACASLSTLLKQFRIPFTERLACKMTDTTRDGTNAGQLRYALDYFHFRFRTLHGKKHLQELKPPALLFVDRRGGYENHTVVFLKKNRNFYIVFDPMEGWQYLNKKQLGKIWHGNGIEVKR